MAVVALIQLLAWEPPYAMDAALKKKLALNYSKSYLKKIGILGVPVVAQWLMNSTRNPGFDPWPRSVG